MAAREYNHRRFFRGGGIGGIGGGSTSRSASISSTNTASGHGAGGSSHARGEKSTGTTLLDSTNTSNNGNGNSNSIASPTTPPRVVTPSKDSAPESPLLHKPTATSGGGLTHASPLKPMEAMRYSLSGINPSKRIETRISKSPSSPLKNYHFSSSMSASSNNKLKVAHSLALQKTMGADATSTGSASVASVDAPVAPFSSENNRGSTNHNINSTPTKSSSSRVLSSSSKLVKQDPNAYKIFLLLLQPQSKIFELIQLIYSPNDTTIGNILEMIPENATEQALGHQNYIGLCRPKTQQELLEKEQLASEARPGMEGTANITLGEILVAIPQGYTGADVASLSRQILSNPKIIKLLKRADPLAPKSKRRRRSSGTAMAGTPSSSSSANRRHKSSSTKLRAMEQVHVLEKHDEVEEEHVNYGGGGGDNYMNDTTLQSTFSATSRSASTSATGRGPVGSTMNKKEAERLMQMAMEHAAAEAAAANAAIPGGATQSKSILIHRSGSIGGISTSQDGGSMAEEEFSAQESFDESFSSWSKSFDASFSAQSSICSGVSKRALRRKDRQSRRMRILQRSAIAAFGLMVVFYVMDPSKDEPQFHQLSETTTQTPMGFWGILQCLFLLLTLYKVERLIRSTQAAQQLQQQSSGGENDGIIMPAIYMSEERRCPFLKAAGRALKRFKHKYSKRLSRKSGGTSGRNPKKHHQQQYHQHQQGGLVAAGKLLEEDTTNIVHHHPKLRSFSLKSTASNPSLQGWNK